MSFEEEGRGADWDEIKKASRRLVGGKQRAKTIDKQVARRYLSTHERDETREQEYPAIPGYN